MPAAVAMTAWPCYLMAAAVSFPASYKMPSYFFRLDDPSRTREEVECVSIEDAQTLAIQYLGDHLIRHPEFAQEGHWKLIVENNTGQPYLHVIVAAVRDRNSPPDVATTVASLD